MNYAATNAVKELRSNFNAAVNGEIPHKVPVVLWSIGHGFANELNIPIGDYYKDNRTKLVVQSKMQETYPDAILMPGVYPDYGVVAEPALFGCPVHWQKQQAPAAEPIFADIKQVDNWQVPDIASGQMARKVIEDIDYLLENADAPLLNKYHYMQGTVFMMGPLETAAMIRGYSEFLMDVVLDPARVKLLLRMVTDGLIEWLKLLEKKYGSIRQLIIADHFPTQISPDHFEEIFLPYMREIYAQYPKAIRVYHNEGQIDHVIHKIPKMGASVFHFGTDIQKTTDLIGDKICLMGNINPIDCMLNGTAKEVRSECLRVLHIGAAKGGFMLSTAGGMSINTPPQNINSMFEAVNQYGVGIA